MSTEESEPNGKTGEREIRQVIPSSGYAAIFFDEETGEPWADTLLGWALVAESGTSPGATSSRMIGLVTDGKTVLFTDEFPNFVGYLPPEGGLDDWKKDVREAWEEQRNQRPDSDTGDERPLQRRKSWLDLE